MDELLKSKKIKYTSGGGSKGGGRAFQGTPGGLRLKITYLSFEKLLGKLLTGKLLRPHKIFCEFFLYPLLISWKFSSVSEIYFHSVYFVDYI